MPYSAPLDGLRAIAILAVLVFHVTPSLLPGGFVGVDVFFVLSGFLITSIVLHDLREGSFSLREFYLRRFQRLLPNIVATVLAVLLLWGLLLPPSSGALAARHGLWTLLNLSNFFIRSHLGGYWGDAVETAPLLHTWSLAIEEQFYLLFPGSLALLARFQQGRVRGWLVGAGVASLAACLLLTPADPVTAFYMLPTRVWELLLGAALAAHRWARHGDGAGPARATPTGALDLLGWFGLAAVAASCVAVDEAGFPGWKALPPTLGTALVLVAVADGQTRVARLLSTGPVVAVGRLSYSLYLWHWPLITLGRMLAGMLGLPRVVGAAGGAVAGVALAWGVYRVVEQPLRSRGPGRRRRVAIIAAGLALALGAAALLARPRPGPDAGQAFEPLTFRGAHYQAARLSADTEAQLRRSARYRDVEFPPPPPRPAAPWREGGIVHPWGGTPPRVVVLGSSHALMYSGLVDDLCRAAGRSVAFLGASGTTIPFRNRAGESLDDAAEAAEFDEARRRWLRAWRPEVVFLVERWDRFNTFSPRFAEELDGLLREVAPLAGRVVFVAQAPVAGVGEDFNLREYVAWRRGPGGELPRLALDANEPRRRQAVAAAEAARARFPNLTVLRADLPFYAADGSLRYAAGRTFLYADDDHLTDAGAELARPLFEAALRGSSGPIR